jgi:hypothetical protein
MKRICSHYPRYIGVAGQFICQHCYDWLYQKGLVVPTPKNGVQLTEKGKVVLTKHGYVKPESRTEQ